MNLLVNRFLKQIVKIVIYTNLLIMCASFQYLNTQEQDNPCDLVFRHPYVENNSWTFTIYKKLNNEDSFEFGSMKLEVIRSASAELGQGTTKYTLSKNRSDTVITHEDRLISENEGFTLKPPRFDEFEFTQISPFPIFSKSFICQNKKSEYIPDLESTLMVPETSLLPYPGTVTHNQYFLQETNFSDKYNQKNYRIRAVGENRFGYYTLEYNYVPTVGFVYFKYSLPDETIYEFVMQ